MALPSSTVRSDRSPSAKSYHRKAATGHHRLSHYRDAQDDDHHAHVVSNNVDADSRRRRRHRQQGSRSADRAATTTVKRSRDLHDDERRSSGGRSSSRTRRAERESTSQSRRRARSGGCHSRRRHASSSNEPKNESEYSKKHQSPLQRHSDTSHEGKQWWELPRPPRRSRPPGGPRPGPQHWESSVSSRANPTRPTVIDGGQAVGGDMRSMNAVMMNHPGVSGRFASSAVSSSQSNALYPSAPPNNSGLPLPYPHDTGLPHLGAGAGWAAAGAVMPSGPPPFGCVPSFRHPAAARGAAGWPHSVGMAPFFANSSWLAGGPAVRYSGVVPVSHGLEAPPPPPPEENATLNSNFAASTSPSKPAGVPADSPLSSHAEADSQQRRIQDGPSSTSAASCGSETPGTTPATGFQRPAPSATEPRYVAPPNSYPNARPAAAPVRMMNWAGVPPQRFSAETANHHSINAGGTTGLEYSLGYPHPHTQQRVMNGGNTQGYQPALHAPPPSIGARLADGSARPPFVSWAASASPGRTPFQRMQHPQRNVYYPGSAAPPPGYFMPRRFIAPVHPSLLHRPPGGAGPSVFEYPLYLPRFPHPEDPTAIGSPWESAATLPAAVLPSHIKPRCYEDAVADDLRMFLSASAASAATSLSAFASLVDPSSVSSATYAAVLNGFCSSTVSCKLQKLKVQQTSLELWKVTGKEAQSRTLLPIERPVSLLGQLYAASSRLFSPTSCNASHSGVMVAAGKSKHIRRQTMLAYLTAKNGEHLPSDVIASQRVFAALNPSSFFSQRINLHCLTLPLKAYVASLQDNSLLSRLLELCFVERQNDNGDDASSSRSFLISDTQYNPVVASLSSQFLCHLNSSPHDLTQFSLRPPSPSATITTLRNTLLEARLIETCRS